MGWQEVVSGERRWSCEASDCLEWLRALPDRTVSLVFFSPPYESQRTYGIGCNLTGQAWVDWMRLVVVESARVSNGLVVVNAAGPVVDRSYSPTMEWLVTDLTRLDGLVCGPAPWCWDKTCGIPGSGSTDYQRRDWEPLYSFALPDRLPLAWTDNTAFGKPPAYAPGGAMSHRQADGVRRNAFGFTDSKAGNRDATGARRKTAVKRHTKRDPDGTMRDQGYDPPGIANPGNVIRCRVGGGHLGSAIAHKGEAPMPVGVAERLVCWYVPPNGLVADPFSGSGTTLDAALQHHRRFVGCDVRPSQVELAGKRARMVTPTLLGT